eukprot:CAMPEP_0184660292 /NCGR_PEP_ID=MMETSP0308-20130426/33368_1 /TAXON_ID=38269 /ORGANISM="Gloeochaete witrockiana, Strain SAG 46.84" /LENGTH=267 /DNA_ID=CAMNT_0027100783 /DNA_START=461 /DNA_END=1265 /DNA_ORIENTATION=-
MCIRGNIWEAVPGDHVTERNGIYLPRLNITWVWDEDNRCNYHPFSKQDIIKYVRGKDLHMIGDSNLRLMVDSLISSTRNVFRAKFKTHRWEDFKDLLVDGPARSDIYYYWRPKLEETSSWFAKMTPSKKNIIFLNSNLHDTRTFQTAAAFRSKVQEIMHIYKKSWESMNTLVFWIGPVPVDEDRHPVKVPGWRMRSQYFWKIIHEEGAMNHRAGLFIPIDIAQMLTYGHPCLYKCCFDNGKPHAVHLEEDMYDLVWQLIFNSIEAQS